MNQILATSNANSKRGKGPASIESIIKFFVISLIILGVFMIGTGSYAIYKDNEERNARPTKPTIEEQLKSEESILLKIRHDKAIDRIEYSWNDNEVKTIVGNGRKYIEQEITIPGGVNILYVKAIDINGQEISYQKQYEAEEIINMAVVGSKLKITADNETEIAYLTYRWDDEEETKIDINDTKVEKEIDIPRGQHTLTVVLVDVNNKTIIKEQEVKGITKPKISVSLDESGENFVIKATDEVELDKVTFIINEDENKKYMVRAEGKKELEFIFPLEAGENKIIATAYNVDGATDEFKARAEK